MPSLPRVALIGRPNVGKSTLFNRLIGQRKAVVADVAGTTRDRLEQVVEWNGKAFVLFDLAGIEPFLTEKTEMNRAIQSQVERSMKTADIVIWVVDVSQEVMPVDEHVAVLLRSLHKPVIVAANKCDDPKHDVNQYQFAQFGFDPIVALSSIHGRGINELLDVVTEKIGEESIHAIPENDRELRITIAGRPNVGKSTLINALAADVRSVVSPEAGTTRDSVDTVIPAANIFGPVFTKWKTVRVIDTAGVRRRGKIEQGIEEWSIIRTLDAVDAAEVVLFMIDASEGLVHQDMQIAQKVSEAGRAMILLVNKWDVILEKKGVIAGTPEDSEAQEKVLDMLREAAPFLHWVQVVFLSAKEGMNLHFLNKVIIKAYNSWNLEIPQEELDELAKQISRQMPRLKNLQGITLEHNRPPVFHLHVEGKQLPHFSTHRYMENVLREHFNIGPTPIKIWSVPSIDRNRKV